MRGSDPKQWKLGLPTFGSVTYREIYPGIDVVYRGNQQQMEFDVVLRPGADPARIRLKFDCASKLSLARDGALVVTSAAGDLNIPLPVVYQEVAGSKELVRGRYRLLPSGEVGFRLNSYDRSKALVIDPTIVYSGLLGGSNNTFAQAIALDSTGNAYVAGYTYAADFPTTNSSVSAGHVVPDAMVTKIDPTGTSRVYSTVIGGSGSDAFYGIAVDSTGAAWMTGYTTSADFPLRSQSYGYTPGAANYAVVVKLDPSGVLSYSTYLGYNATGRAIAVDGSGNAYAAGVVTGTVPATPGAYLTSPAGGFDGFVTKFNSTGSVVYCTYLGGSGSDQAFGVAVDGSFNAYVTGDTTSASWANAPGGAQPTVGGSTDAFIAKLNPMGTALSYLTFLGGSQAEKGEAIAVDASGYAYVGGSTNSTDFPVTPGAYQNVLRGAQNGFVAKVNNGGLSFVYVTYLGGVRSDDVHALAIDTNGNAYVTGQTNSAQFPTMAPIEASLPGNGNSIFSTANSGTGWSSFDTSLPGTAAAVSPDPVVAGTVVASTETGVYRTTNSGTTWSLAPPGVSNAQISRSASNSSTIYAVVCCASAVYKSTDGGASFQFLGSTGTPTTTILADPLNANVAYAYYAQNPTGAPILKITSGSTLSVISATTGLPSGSPKVNTMVGASDGTIYADIDGSGVYKSTNQGASWVVASTGLPGSPTAPLNGLAVSASSPQVLYKSSGGSVIYKTINGGSSWSAVPGTAPAGLGALAVSPSNPAVVYAATVAGSYPPLYISSDSGATWTAATSGLGLANLTQIVPSPANASAAYALALPVSAAFAAELNGTGTALVYSTYLGNGGNSSGQGVAVNGSDAFIAGSGYGSFATFATAGTPVGAALQSNANDSDAFVVRISPATPVGSGCTYAVTPSSQTIGSASAVVTFNVVSESGCAWTSSSPQSWASIATGGSSSGMDFVSVAVPANSGPTHSATLTIAGQSVNLTQAGISCSYSLGTPSASLTASGGIVTTTVNTAAGCPWSVTNNYPSAVSITSGASGTGSGSVSLTVASNAAASAQVFTIGIGTATLTITEASASGGSSGLRFIPITPCRVVDTRNPTGQFGGPIIATNTTRTFNIPSGSCNIPATAQAYSFGVVVVPPGQIGYLSLWPTGQPQPLVSTLNSDGRVKSNAAIVPAGTNGSINAYSSNATHLVLDINGYFVAASDPTALAFFPVTPCRIADTRNPTGPLGGPSIALNSTRTFPIQSACGIPASAQAYSLNLTAVPKGALQYLTAWPTGQVGLPLASTLNDPTATVVLANAAIVPAWGRNGSVDIYAAGVSDVVIDINGYFAPMTTGGLSLYNVTPCRVLDTRFSGTNQPITLIDVGVSSSACGIPAGAQAYVSNVTVVPPAPMSYLSMWPQGQSMPLVSTLNAQDAAVTANMAIVPTTNGAISIYASSPTHVVLDVSGYFAQ